MTDALSTLALLQISDSAFPSGAFAFSAGLETLVSEARVSNPQQVGEFLEGQILSRWCSFDRWFLTQAYVVKDYDDLIALDHSCEAHNTISGLSTASCRIGRATLSSHDRIGTPGIAQFYDALRKGHTPGHAAIAQAIVGRGMGLDLALVETGALSSLMAGTLSAAVRLGVLGALQAQSILSAIRPELARRLDDHCPEAPSSFSPLADIAAMRHRQNSTRLFAV